MSNDTTVSVRIRMGEAGKAYPLCHWPVNDLDSLIRSLDAWGYADADGNTADASAFGQFVIGDDAAYFEVVVSQDGE